MPVRSVSNHGGNIIGKFPSLKLKRMVSFESLIERDCLYILDYEPTVEWFEEQPLTLEYEYDGKTLHYTPDFHVVEAGREVLVECKPAALTGRDENQRKFRAAQAWCAERGWEFRVVTDRQLRAGHRLANIKLLTYYARLSIPPQVKGEIYTLLTTTMNGTSVGEVAQALVPNNRALALPVIMHLVFHGEVSVPLAAAPLTLDSPISLPVALTNPLLEVRL